MAVSKSKRAAALKRSAKLIKGRATRGTWLKIRKKKADRSPRSQAGYIDRGINSEHVYEEFRKDPNTQLMFGPNSEVECKMCMEGAIYTACALEDIPFADAQEIVQDVSRAEFFGPGRIPGFNDQSKSLVAIEKRLEGAVEKIVGKEDQ